MLPSLPRIEFHLTLDMPYLFLKGRRSCYSFSQQTVWTECGAHRRVQTISTSPQVIYNLYLLLLYGIIPYLSTRSRLKFVSIFLRIIIKPINQEISLLNFFQKNTETKVSLLQSWLYWLFRVTITSDWLSKVEICLNRWSRSSSFCSFFDFLWLHYNKIVRKMQTKTT